MLRRTKVSEILFYDIRNVLLLRQFCTAANQEAEILLILYIKIFLHS